MTSFLNLFGYFGENLSNSISTPNFIMIELETTKLGERLRTLAPALLPIRWPTQVVTTYANKLANDPFVGLRVAVNDMHR